MFEALMKTIRRIRRGDPETVDNTRRNPDATSPESELANERMRLAELGTLAASITHDLRQPLAIIDAEIEWLRHRVYFEGPLMKHIERIEDQTRAIYAVTQYVNVVRGTKDYYEPFMEKLRLGDLVHRTLKAIKREPEASGVFFKYEDRPAFIWGYGAMVEQAIFNVLKNAVEAIREARREHGVVSIGVRIDALNEILRLDVRDNGCGIDETSIPHLTTLFTTKADKKANSGIGLFITQRILKLHSGKLEIASVVGTGTTVSLCFPKWKN